MNNVLDNLNLENKRLRCNEYIASLLTAEFSKRLNRVISLGAKATIKDYTDMFKFSGEILIQKMHSSGVLRFDDNINDLDFSKTGVKKVEYIVSDSSGNTTIETIYVTVKKDNTDLIRIGQISIL